MSRRELLADQLTMINTLASWDYEVQTPAEGVVLVLASNDFSYYHHLEVEFQDVRVCDLPRQFSHAHFRLGDVTDDQITVWIAPEYVPESIAQQEYEVQAASFVVRPRKVYYYDRPAEE